MSSSGSQVLYPATASALLGLAESRQRARPLRSWSAAQREAVRARFAAVLRDWCAEWLVARDGAVAAAPHIEVDEDAHLAHEAACWAFAAASSAAPRGTAVDAVANELFGIDAASFRRERETPALAAAVAQAAWSDWLERIAMLVSPVPLTREPRDSARPLDGAAVDRWSGALRLHGPWCGGIWHLEIPHAAVAALLGEAAQPMAVNRQAQAPSKVSLDHALKDHRVPLWAMLASVELDLGQLQALKPGDIVPLAHALDTPVQLRGADGTPVCEGWLGQLDGHMAVELSQSAALASSSLHLAKETTP